MPNTKKWSLGVILTTIIAVVFTFGALAPVSAAADDLPVEVRASGPADACDQPADSSTDGKNGYTAPDPTKRDISGVDNDGICIPLDSFKHPQYGFGMYQVNGKSLEMGFHKVKKGVTSVTVTSTHSSGTWTFTFSDAAVKKEAKNTFGLEVGEKCKMGEFQTRYREVWWTFTNTLETNLPDGVTEGPMVHSIYPYVIGFDGSMAYDTEYANGIADGQTVRMRVMESEDKWPGLTPGKYKVSFWRADKGPHADYKQGYVVKRMTLTVPRCGKKVTQPIGKQARGKLKRPNCQQVKAVANARGYTSAPTATYKVVKKLKGKKAQKRTFAVKAGQKRSVVVKKPKGAKATVVLKVKRGVTWVKLDRKVVPRCK